MGDAVKNTWNRGYEPLRFQMLEANTSPDLKEGYIIAEDLPKTHPSHIHKKLNAGPNVWPDGIDNLEEFQTTCMDYFHAVVKLANEVISVIALTLDLEPTFFDECMQTTCSTVRFLHYPPQPPDADEKYRGVGAHTDFGSITLLAQDDVDGLQVWDQERQTWLDVSGCGVELSHPQHAELTDRPGRAHARRIRRESGQSVHEVVERQVQVQPAPCHQQVGERAVLDSGLYQRQSRLRHKLSAKLSRRRRRAQVPTDNGRRRHPEWISGELRTGSDVQFGRERATNSDGQRRTCGGEIVNQVPKPVICALVDRLLFPSCCT